MRNSVALTASAAALKAPAEVPQMIGNGLGAFLGSKRDMAQSTPT